MQGERSVRCAGGAFRTLLLRACSAIALSVTLAAFAQEKEPERTGGPYVPTPQIVVDQMLRMANVGPKDFVIDLGSGDGVIVLTAARERKASGIGVDIDAALVKRSNAQAKKLGIDDRASFQVQDVFKTDLSRASVITLYLLPSMMVNLRPKIFLEPRPGTRVVSHDYSFDEWQPDDQFTFEVPEKEKVNGVPSATVHLWIVPAKVQGNWHVQIDASDPYELSLQQIYQVVNGSASTAGKTSRLTYASLRGEEITFAVGEGSLRRIFKGAVRDDAMHGTVDLGGGRTAQWSAKRL